MQLGIIQCFSVIPSTCVTVTVTDWTLIIYNNMTNLVTVLHEEKKIVPFFFHFHMADRTLDL